MLSGRGWSGAWRYGARWRGVLFSLLSYSLRMTGSFIDKYELQGLAALSLTNIKTHRTDVGYNWPQENGYESDRKTIGINSEYSVSSFPFLPGIIISISGEAGLYLVLLQWGSLWLGILSNLPATLWLPANSLSVACLPFQCSGVSTFTGRKKHMGT